MDSTSTTILAVSLIIIMFGMGLSLVANDFKRIFVSPKAIFVGLLNQIVLLPLVAFFLINIFDLRAEIAIGIIILSACPGGATSNLITHLAKGDTALSVSLTAISSFLTLVTIPIIVNLGLSQVLGASQDIRLDVVQTMTQVFVIVIIPVIVGMVVRAKNQSFADRMERPVRIASVIVFALVVIGIVLKEKDNIIDYFSQAGTVSLLLNLITMSLGFAAGKLFTMPFSQRIAISIESGIQNGTLGIAVATVLLQNTEYAIAPAVYSLIMFFTGGIFILWALRARNR